MSDGAMELIFWAVIIGSLLGFIALVINYVVNGWSMMRVAEEKGFPSWMSWAPVVDIYLLFKVARGKMWMTFTLLAIPLNMLNELVKSDIIDLVASILFLWLLIYQLVLLYRLGQDYDASKLLFWLGVFILPCQWAYLIQIGRRAKARVEISGFGNRSSRRRNKLQTVRREPHYSPSILRPDNNPYSNDYYDDYDDHDDCDSGDCDCDFSNDD